MAVKAALRVVNVPVGVPVEAVRDTCANEVFKTPIKSKTPKSSILVGFFIFRYKLE